MIMIDRAYSATDVYRAKFNELEFDSEWLAAIGKPEMTGSWIIYGPPKNGKTSFAMMLAKYLTKFGRVYYNSVEEGLSKTIQMAYRRVDMIDVKGKILLQKETFDSMVARLKLHKSPEFVFVDSVQFMKLKFEQYRELKETFPKKIFIYISHVQGRLPEGNDALGIMRDSNVICRVEGRRAFIETRYEGDGYIDIDSNFAMKYWTGQSK